MRKDLTHKENILLKIKHLNDVVDNTNHYQKPMVVII